VQRFSWISWPSRSNALLLRRERTVLRKVVLGFGLLVAVVVAAVVAVMVWPQLLPATVPNPWARLSIKPLANNVYWVQGGVSNTGFVVGTTGVVVIDPQMFTVTARQALKKIAAITPKPVNAIILTHSDPDHVNGLPAYPIGMTIFAHENTRTDMLRALAGHNRRWISTPSAAVRNYLPTRLVRDRTELLIDGVPLVLLNYGPAHTDGDLVVYLTGQKIVFAGDLLAPTVGPYPGIHANKHGTSLGWIKSVTEMLRLDANIFVSGHGEPQTREQVQARLQVAEQRRAQIKALVDEHKSLDEVKAALHDPPPTGVARMFPTFTETTFQELTGAEASNEQ
jgi:glyoxylase-like metal-dependent hydrolase (beta-lactamase superfamily II)